jgi:hypothetical protein
MSRIGLDNPFKYCVLVVSLASFSSTASAELRWTGVRHACLSPGVGEVTARLDGIPAFQRWEDTCENKIAGQRPPNLNQYGASGLPGRCEKDLLSTGIWGKWRVTNDARCPSPLRWEGWKKAGCFGPNKQVYSARLMGSNDWENDCASTDTAGVAGKSDWGTPDRCAKDAKPTGIWGEWYRDEACEVPLQWGGFKDNGCVKDMEAADVNAGGISFEGKRSYSSVLWIAGGHWEEACKFAPATIVGPSGAAIAEFEHPTGCVIADADRALSYVVGAVIGAGTGLIASPASPKAAAALGAVTGLAGTAATEALLAGVNTSLNVWGIFWVDDASCGAVPSYPPLDETGFVRLATGQIVPTDPTAEAVTVASNNLSGSRSSCPATAESLRGTGRSLACACTAAQTSDGTVGGGGPYTDDTRRCGAAVHAGLFPATGGTIEIQAEKGQSSFDGSSRNGVTTSTYGAWPGSVSVRQAR